MRWLLIKGSTASDHGLVYLFFILQSPKGSDSPVKSKQTWADEPDASKKISRQSKQREDLLLGKLVTCFIANIYSMNLKAFDQF